MSKPLILVNGATGKTGIHVVPQLLEQGFPVRAIVHSLDERSQRLEELGAEIFLGDLLDLASIRSAMKNVKRAYFCFPTQNELLIEATTIFAPRISSLSPGRTSSKGWGRPWNWQRSWG